MICTHESVLSTFQPFYHYDILVYWEPLCHRKDQSDSLEHQKIHRIRVSEDDIEVDDLNACTENKIINTNNN